MRFTHPGYLLLLLPALGLLFWSFPRIVGMSRTRKIRSHLFRFLLFSLLVIALAGPEMYLGSKGRAVIFVVDRSDSIRDVQKEFQDQVMQNLLSQLGPDDISARVAFGRAAVVDTSPGKRQSFGLLNVKLERNQSDIAGAMRLASALMPEGKSKQIVLLSDGNETTGNALSAAEVAQSEGIVVDFVPLPKPKEVRDALISSVVIPTNGNQSQPFDIRVEIDSSGIQTGVLQIDRDGVIVSQKQVSLSEGVNSVIIPQKIDSKGLVRYRVQFQSPLDTDVRNNSGSGFVNVRGKPTVLVVQDNTKDAALSTALERSGISVDLVEARSIPARPEALQIYDSIILNDVNASNITESVQRSLVSASRDSGIGLAMIGGENSFLPGGWYGTPLIEALPVDLNIRQKKSVAAVSVLVIADCSGSMGAIEDGQPKVKMASRAAEETIKMLGPMDRIGVAGSSDGIEVVAPMQSAANKEAAIEGARKLAVSGGGIYVSPSITRAYSILKDEPSKTRHFILLADGNDATDWDSAFQTATQMRSEKITTSVVAIGNGRDVPNLRQLAFIGGGRFYLATKASQLPAMFTQDTSLMARSAIEEGAFLPKIVQNAPSIEGVFDGGCPPLLAYCLVESKSLARTILKTKKDDPLYITGKNGLSSTFCFMSDAKSQWAERWISWGGFSKFWSQTVRDIGRKATRNKYEISTRSDGGQAIIEVSAKDVNGNPLTNSETPVRISSPDGKSQEIQLSQVAPGKFEAAFETSKVGSYIASVVEDDGQGGSLVQASGLSVSYPAEYRSVKTNDSLLTKISEITNGKKIVDPKDLSRRLAERSTSYAEIWPFLLLGAILFLPFEIGHRRIVVSLHDLFEKSKLKKKSPTKPESTMTELKLARDRVKVRNEVAIPVQVKPREVKEPVKQPQPSPTKDSSESTTAASLLAKKRQRNDKQEP